LITGFDHVVIAVRDLAAGVAAYEQLLDRRAETPTHRDGVAHALIATGNIAVELMAPVGEGETARRLSAALEGGEGLKSLVFAVDDIDRAHRRCERVGLAPSQLSASREPVSNGQDAGAARSFRVDTGRSHGVRLFLMQRRAPARAPAGGAAVTGLDHVVISTGQPDRAAALYGARLGLDMRLDREVAGRRLMFFRCGDAVVEIAHDPALGDGRDRLWGLSWRVADADAARARLAGAGVSVSEVRPGLKPGTRVFTVRDRTCGAPTLMIQPSPKRD
jgi:catechol 2,3-dioxygenase-like lactoylglutathione lyase family enzyme